MTDSHFTDNRLTDKHLTDRIISPTNISPTIISPTGTFHRQSFHRHLFYQRARRKIYDFLLNNYINFAKYTFKKNISIYSICLLKKFNYLLNNKLNKITFYTNILEYKKDKNYVSKNLY